MIDQRTDIDLKNIRNGKPINTFKRELDFWNIKPNLMSYKEIPPNKKDFKEFRASVHHLKRWNQIMHIVPDVKDPDRIYFLFFEDFGDYNYIGKESAERREFDAAMVSNDLRQEQDKVFVVILFSLNHQ